MSREVIVEAAHGVPFTIRVIFQGDVYGLNNCLKHKKSNPLIEFYDRRYMHTEYGQFVSRYYLSTLMKDRAGRGINLHGGEPSWVIDYQTLKLALVELLL